MTIKEAFDMESAKACQEWPEVPGFVGENYRQRRKERLEAEALRQQAERRAAEIRRQRREEMLDCFMAGAGGALGLVLVIAVMGLAG